MDDEPATGCLTCLELRVEVERLRARLAQVEAERDRLVQAALRRDYERPPHY